MNYVYPRISTCIIFLDMFYNMTKEERFMFTSPSRRANKKYDAYDLKGNYIVSFGALKKNGEPYDQFHDRIGAYEKYDHLDKKRRANYYKRHKKNYPRYSADWFSKEFLW